MLSVGGLARWRQRAQARLAANALVPPVVSSDEEEDELVSERLQLQGCKPFGKSGVRVAWALGSAVLAEDGCRVYLDAQSHDGGDWTEQSELAPAGKASGLSVLKSSIGIDLPPSKLQFRLRSSAGDVSGPTWLGKPWSGVGKPRVPASPGKVARSLSLRGGFSAVARSRAVPSAVAAAAAAISEQPTGGASAGSGISASSSSTASTASNDIDDASLSPEAAASLGHDLKSTVQTRLGEVGFLLRIDLKDAQSLHDAREQVDQALAFDAKLDQLAMTAGKVKGRLFQALLEELRAQGASHAQMDNSNKNLFGGAMVAASEFGLDLVTWSRLTVAADELRQLVRIKVADDNDLKTARSGLVLAAELFAAVTRLAKLQAKEEWAVLQEANELAA